MYSNKSNKKGELVECITLKSGMIEHQMVT